MGSAILKFENGMWVIWSTIADAPMRIFSSKKDLEDWCLIEEGRRYCERELPGHLKRAEEKGCSTYGTETLREFIEFNRAGPNEECLTYDEIVAEIKERREKITATKRLACQVRVTKELRELEAKIERVASNTGILAERRPNGNSRCKSCGHTKTTWDWRQGQRGEYLETSQLAEEAYEVSTRTSWGFRRL